MPESDNNKSPTGATGPVGAVVILPEKKPSVTLPPGVKKSNFNQFGNKNMKNNKFNLKSNIRRAGPRGG